MNGRVALVTGGGRGIGREAALLLSAAGARVMWCRATRRNWRPLASNTSRPISARPRAAPSRC